MCGIAPRDNGRIVQLPVSPRGLVWWPFRFCECQSGGLLSKPTTGESAGWNLWKSRQKYEKRRRLSKAGYCYAAKTSGNQDKTQGKTMNQRDTAWCLLTEFTQSESLRKHALAVEACMRAYARKAGAECELWDLDGLLQERYYGE